MENIATTPTKSTIHKTRRTILKQELVKKLYPDSISTASALQQLRREIQLCPDLQSSIKSAGNIKRHYYNRKQLHLILAHFSIVPEEFEAM